MQVQLTTFNKKYDLRICEVCGKEFRAQHCWLARGRNPKVCSKLCRSDVPYRFWKYVDKSGGPGACWPWLGSYYPSGYGQFVLADGTHTTAHRVAYELETGKKLDELHGCHHCDNKACTNPIHVFPGTVSDNLLDMSAKGRHYIQRNPARHLELMAGLSRYWENRRG